MQNGEQAFAHLLDSRPTVGRLTELCEENYERLCRLVPGLRRLQAGHACRVGRQTELYLEVLEQARFMSRIRLTHYFDASRGTREPDPDMEIRVYHDARVVEVLGLRQHVLPTHTLYQAPGLLNKWRANLFLAKWLLFCLQQGHCFVPDRSATEAIPA